MTKWIFKIKRKLFKLALASDGYYLTLIFFFREHEIIWHQFKRPIVAWHDFKFKVKNALAHLQVWPVYFEVFTRDCDLCESTSLYKAPCYSIGIRRLKRAALDWTEGPFHWRQLSRKEAKEFKPHWRDRIGEAFDNGDGTKVIL